MLPQRRLLSGRLAGAAAHARPTPFLSAERNLAAHRGQRVGTGLLAKLRAPEAGDARDLLVGDVDALHTLRSNGFR